MRNENSRSVSLHYLDCLNCLPSTFFSACTVIAFYVPLFCICQTCHPLAASDLQSAQMRKHTSKFVLYSSADTQNASATEQAKINFRISRAHTQTHTRHGARCQGSFHFSGSPPRGWYQGFCLFCLCVMRPLTQAQNNTQNARSPACTLPPALSPWIFKLWMAASCQGMKAVGKRFLKEGEGDSGGEEIRDADRCSAQCFLPLRGEKRGLDPPLLLLNPFNLCSSSAFCFLSKSYFNKDSHLFLAITL